jgi:hypothetical protein
MLRQLSLYQTVIAVVALVGISVLGAIDKVSSDALIAVYSMTAGSALGYVNGKRNAHPPAVVPSEQDQ